MFRALTALFFVVFALEHSPGATTSSPSDTGWQKPPAGGAEVLHAPRLPSVWTAPTGEYLLLADPVLYPPPRRDGGPHARAGRHEGGPDDQLRPRTSRLDLPEAGPGRERRGDAARSASRASRSIR